MNMANVTPIDTSRFQHHHAIESVLEIICTKVQNDDKPFFRVLTAHILMQLAATMRATLSTKDRGEIPINGYTLALSTSGAGKGHSIGILEDGFCKGFRQHFSEVTLPVIAENHLWKLATKRAVRNDSEEQDEFDKLKREYEDKGAYPHSFDSGTSPAVKQVREKLLMAGIGSINLQIDEIGNNLIGNTEVLNTFLELYDQGKVKQKLTKNTAENKRTEEIEGKTPANMLLFGTPSRLLDGSSVENHFFSFLDAGYARRCIFGMGHPIPASENKTAAEIYESLINAQNEAQLNNWATHFTSLAHEDKFNWLIDVPDDISIQLIEYKMWCEHRANELSEFAEIQRAEMKHRYFKAVKLAGALAFVDEATELEADTLNSAIKLVEESGDAFQKLLKRERAYAKLARYIAGTDEELTHADLDELPFYPKSTAQRNQIISEATAWGYKNHIVVKKTFSDGIEFFSGEALKETSLDAVALSYSDDFAYGYEPVEIPFEDLHKLTQEAGYHWCNHAFKGEHRSEDTTIPGFNLVVLDVDEGTTLEAVHELLEDFTFMTHTTRRHTDEEHRFRLILPMSYQLKLDKPDYREFMKNVYSWLPFKVDTSTIDRSRKWMTNSKGSYHYNITEQLLDVLPFVPKTSRNAEYNQRAKDLQSLDNLERWFADRIANGNRNNQMIKFALALVDSGMSYTETESKVLAFNAKLKEGLSDDELRKTVLVTVAKKLQGNP